MISTNKSRITTREWIMKFLGKTKNVTKRKRNEIKYKTDFFVEISKRRNKIWKVSV